MPLRIELADYGVGNLHSIRKALENCGAEVHVAEDMALLERAECIVLPGVGAFDRAMERLRPHGEAIMERLDEGVPCLGICIGMQVLFQRSAEGASPGLGFLEGEVVRLSAPRVPHMGWNEVVTADAIMDGIEDRHFYFAHSFRGRPTDGSAVGHTDHFGSFPSLFRKRNVYGTQFHPEKSSSAGLAFLRNFVRFAEGCA